MARSKDINVGQQRLEPDTPFEHHDGSHTHTSPGIKRPAPFDTIPSPKRKRVGLSHKESQQSEVAQIVLPISDRVHGPSTTTKQLPGLIDNSSSTEINRDLVPPYLEVEHCPETEEYPKVEMTLDLYKFYTPQAARAQLVREVKEAASVEEILDSLICLFVMKKPGILEAASVAPRLPIPSEMKAYGKLFREHILRHAPGISPKEKMQVARWSPIHAAICAYQALDARAELFGQAVHWAKLGISRTPRASPQMSIEYDEVEDVVAMSEECGKEKPRQSHNSPADIECYEEEKEEEGESIGRGVKMVQVNGGSATVRRDLVVVESNRQKPVSERHANSDLLDSGGHCTDNGRHQDSCSDAEDQSGVQSGNRGDREGYTSYSNNDDDDSVSEGSKSDSYEPLLRNRMKSPPEGFRPEYWFTLAKHTRARLRVQIKQEPERWAAKHLQGLTPSYRAEIASRLPEIQAQWSNGRKKPAPDEVRQEYWDSLSLPTRKKFNQMLRQRSGDVLKGIVLASHLDGFKEPIRSIIISNLQKNGRKGIAPQEIRQEYWDTLNDAARKRINKALRVRRQDVLNGVVLKSHFGGFHKSVQRVVKSNSKK